MKNTINKLLLMTVFLALQQGCTVMHNTTANRANWLSITNERTRLSFDYKGSTAMADKEKILPVGIRVKLPLGLIMNTVIDGCFIFYYSNKQSIIISTSAQYMDDTTFIADEHSSQNFLATKVPIMFSRMTEVRDYGYDSKRKSLIIRKGNVTVLLYNIKKGMFAELASEMKTLETY